MAFDPHDPKTDSARATDSEFSEITASLGGQRARIQRDRDALVAEMLAEKLATAEGQRDAALARLSVLEGKAS